MTMKTDTRPHELAEDIRAVILIEKLAEVNYQGETIGVPVLSEDIHRRAWRCTPCDVEFHQWAAVMSHLRGLCPVNTPTTQESSGGSHDNT